MLVHFLASEKLPCVHLELADPGQVRIPYRSASNNTVALWLLAAALPPASATTTQRQTGNTKRQRKGHWWLQLLIEAVPVTTNMAAPSWSHWVLVMAFLTPFASAINCKGCTPLDTLSFDKLLGKFRVSVIKFDVAYPYGDKHDEFAKFSTSAAELEDLFVGKTTFFFSDIPFSMFSFQIDA